MKKIGQIQLISFHLLLIVFSLAVISTYFKTNFSVTDFIILGLIDTVVFFVNDSEQEFYNRGYLLEFIHTAKSEMIFVLFVVFINFLLKNTIPFSRKDLIVFIVLKFLGTYGLNVIVKRYRYYIYPKLLKSKKYVVLTVKARLQDTLKRLNGSGNLNGEVVGICVLDDANDESSGGKFIPRAEMIAFATYHVVDEVFANLPSDKYRVSEIVSQFESMGIDVSFNINAYDLNPETQKKLQRLADFNVITFSTRFYSETHIIAKRALDIIGAIVGLVLCAIVSIVLVPLIIKDGGPAIFSQERVGMNGRIFKFYKFRSMVPNAEELKKELESHNQMQGAMFKMDDDPRITKVGKFIRKTSLDELPQFYNVLRGDMSLVGTRPPTVKEYETYTPSQKKRLSFKPGITGLWQVSGRSNITDFDEVVKLDVAYIDSWSIWSDIKILLKTIRVVFQREGSK
ncbi:sugar transferase [Streptococcus merionis]|uniref:Glycosyl transferase family protein n=1 Tax=Streptococcus merionis TaxID=400065 RepID=A0A239SSA1_9STRE|nr:sugar transferase [Streptococcus merionis]SNU88287.1 glycosyl transferase family protein [Streptococcus merionis]